MSLYIAKLVICGCERHPALPPFSEVIKDALCPSCRILVCIDHLQWIDEQFRKRGGIFQSRATGGKDHQLLKKDWRKTRVAVAKLVGQYESLVEAEERWNEEHGADLSDLQKEGGVITALAKWRDYEELMVSVAGIESGEDPGTSGDKQNEAEHTDPQHSVIFPQFRINSIKPPALPPRRASTTSVHSLGSPSSKSSLKSALKGSTNPVTPSSKHIRISDIVTVSPEHLNHTHFDAPMLSRSPTHQPHNKHVDAEYKKTRGGIIRFGPTGISRSSWASNEEHEKVNTSKMKVQWDVVEDEEQKAALYHKIAGFWVLLWYLARAWHLLDWALLRKEFKKRIGDPDTWGQGEKKDGERKEDDDKAK